MKDDKTGGPAFPAVRIVGREYQGMTLRDYFAGQALAGFLANPAATEAQTSVEHEGSLEELAALASYSFADAMLKERER